MNEIKYCFVLDANEKQLAPTKVNKAWFLIRKNRARPINKFPMVIQLNKTVDEPDQNSIICGIDDGSVHTGIALIQKCPSKNKAVFKGTIEHRQDVKKLMDLRKGYRQYRRQQKRYRPAHFSNRASSRREGRLAPSILQKKQAILRVINTLNKWIKIGDYYLEDVAVDIRALTEGHKLHSWQYQKSNRLDENLRKATLIRDEFTCQECGKQNIELQAHHIRPRHLRGANTLSNLITLCKKCHDKTKNKEHLFEEKYFSKIRGKTFRLDYAQHVMQGKLYLRVELSKLGALHLTTGADTANKRIDWGIEKTHSNDALCITNLKPNITNLKDWIIKPMRRQSKAKIDNVLGIKHKDLVSYTYKNGETYVGYVTALYPNLLALNFQSLTKHCKKVNVKKCKLLWKFNKIYWLDKCV